MNSQALLPAFAFGVMSFGLIMTAVWLWNRRPPVTKTAAMLMLTCAVWLLAWLLALLSADLDFKTALLLLRYAAIASTPTTWLILALQYSGYANWLTRRRLALLIFPLVVLGALLLTNSSHQLIYRAIELDPVDPLLTMHRQHGPGFWIFSAYGYAVLLAGNLVVVRMLSQSYSLYRRQVLALLAATLLPALGGLYDMFQGGQGHLPLAPIAIAITCLTVTVTLIRLRRDDILSVARHTIIDGLSDGIVVVDNFDRIVSLNPAARRLMPAGTHPPVGQTIQRAWPALAAVLADSLLTVERPIEKALPSANEPQIFDVRLTALRDTAGQTTSRIVTLRDITQRKATEQREHEQFQALQRQAAHNAGLIEVTRAINSTMNVPDLLGLIVDNVAALIQAQHGSLWLLNETGTHLSMQAMYNLPSMAHATRFAIGEGIAGWVAHTGQGVIVDNAANDPRYTILPSHEHLHAMVCVPLISRGHVIGVLSLDRNAGEPPFSASEFRTVQDYAQHATLALTKARLMEATHLQFDQLQAIYQLSDAVAQAASIDAIFETALDTLLRTTHADRAAILLRDPDGVMRFKAWRGLSDRYRQHTEGHSPWVPDAVDPQPVLIEDIEQEPSLTGLRPIIAGEGLRALGFIPLINQRQLLGKFMIYYQQPHHFTEIQVAQTVAYHVSFAIVRLRAQTALRDSEARFRTLVESQGEGVSLIDPEENCRFANPAANTIFGVDSLIGRNLRDFMSHEQFVQLRTQTDRRRRGERSTYDLEIVRPNGERRSLIVTATPQLDAAGSFVGALTVWMDITERKRAEEQLKASLLEKEVLLKEIHHRVKNNLQVVHSLLNLQSSQTTDAASLEALRDSQNRVRSMALVHETLYRSPDLARVDFAEYVSDLAAQLAQSYRIDSTSVQLSVHATSEVRLGIDVAIPCGLIINELVSNALKHAFPAGRAGTVTVRLTRRSAEIVAMTVADDGVGLPPGFDYTRTESLGLQLIGQLVRQIRGCLTVQHDGGTQFAIEFQAH